jgi:hypothetical protein
MHAQVTTYKGIELSYCPDVECTWRANTTFAAKQTAIGEAADRLCYLAKQLWKGSSPTADDTQDGAHAACLQASASMHW